MNLRKQISSAALVFAVILALKGEDMPTLSWIGRKEATNATKDVVMKILREDKALSYAKEVSREEREEQGELFNQTGRDARPSCPQHDNILVHGDNLEALHALLPFYAGRVKCIYIDPPYNTGNIFENYDDNLEHSTWLNVMYPRLKILSEFLAPDGCIWIQIDDDEQAYLKVICDEVYGRRNFVNMISVNMKNVAGASGGGEDKRIKKNCEYILVYAKHYDNLKTFAPAYEYEEIYGVVEQYRREGKTWHYNSVLVDRGIPEYCCSTTDGDGNEIKIFRRSGARIMSVRQLMEQENISERDVYYKYGTMIFEAKDAQSSIRERVRLAKGEHNLHDDILSIQYVPKTGRNKGLLYEQFYKGDGCRLFAWLQDISEVIDGVLYRKKKLGTYWDMTRTMNNLTKEGDVVFAKSKKPEALVQRIFDMCTNPGDLVLDSFLGSGTTAAVAQKMGRRWIGIEMGEHAKTHCAVRLKKVIDGEQGGISKAVKWKGGGSFRFYELGEPILKKDGTLTEGIPFETMAAHVWFTQTKMPFGRVKIEGEGEQGKKSTIIGVDKDVAYALLYNGILGDKRVSGGNVLTKKTLKVIKDDLILATTEEERGKLKSIVVYGEASRLSDETLKNEKIDFRQTPYDLVTRK